jgi:GNAT superfamily N-acetyltransferase
MASPPRPRRVARHLHRPDRHDPPASERVLSTDISARAASRAEADRLGAALAAAFEDDPVFSWLIPNRPSRLRRLELFFELELQHVVLPTGRVWTTDASSGASLELPPGCWRMPIVAQLAHGPTFARVFGTRLPHAFALITKMEHRHLREPHYYIPYVGVAPHAQGQGLGTSLLRPTLDRCDRERLPAYLEATSERNAALYARLGFEHLGQFTLGNSPSLWPMRRPPAPAPR